MILAAGRGERMMPLTEHTPKPLLELSGKPLIDYQIQRLSSAGIRNFVVNCGRFGDKIIEHLSKKYASDLDFQFSIEGENILNTGGGILNALPLIQSDPFIVVNADVWCDMDYKPLLSRCSLSGHLVLVNNPDHNPMGDFGLDKEFLINDLEPKLTFSGIGVYQQALFQDYPVSTIPLVKILSKAAAAKRLSGEIFSGHWCDIGTPERLKKMQTRMDLFHK